MLCTAAALLLSFSLAAAGKAPNIVFILGDDWGWNDVSFHGSGDSRTPNIDSIAADGMDLNQYRVNPVCSPTRASLQSGRSVIHHGIQVPFGWGIDVGGLNLSMSLLPEQLTANFNYSSYAIGKWHLGYKGYQRYYGYYVGMDYWTHTTTEGWGVNASCMVLGGSDFGFEPGHDVAVNHSSGMYSTAVLGDKAVEWIGDHVATRDNPFFLYLAYEGIHSANSEFIQAPPDIIDEFTEVSPNDTCPQFSEHCSDAAKRKSVVAAVSAVDNSVGKVLQALKQHGIDNNTLVIFSTDNGGPAGMDANMANNYPLRGGKAGYFDGGLRGVGAMKGPGLKAPPGTVYNGLMHVSDWYKTLLSAAADLSGTPYNATALPQPPFLPGDGVDNWAALAAGVGSARSEIVHVTQPPGAPGAQAITSGSWKFMYDGDGKIPYWYAPPGGNVQPFKPTVDCGSAEPAGKPAACSATAPCLFNITADPCEHVNLAGEHPEVVAEMKAKLAQYATHAVYDWTRYRGKTDPCGSPARFDRTVLSFMSEDMAARYYPLNYTVPPVAQLPPTAEECTMP